MSSNHVADIARSRGYVLEPKRLGADIHPMGAPRGLLAALLAVVGMWLAVGSAVELANAARGDTGDTARAVPAIFGAAGLAAAVAIAAAAVVAWRRPRGSHSE